MRVSFNIKESIKDISKKLLGELRLIASKHLSDRLVEVQEAIKPIIYDAVYNSPEMDSCRNDYLKAEFGLDFDPTEAISRAVADSVSTTMARSSIKNNRVIGSMTIEIQPSEYMNLLQLPESIVITENGAKLPWLSWLLLYGNSVIIVDYGIRYEFGKGRSGLGYMRKKATPYRVHPAYSGDANDNFITRALNSTSTRVQLDNVISTVLSR